MSAKNQKKPSTENPALKGEDLALIKRVLCYAAPFKWKIVLALGIGMLAGVLTVLNLLALIPVLNILFPTGKQMTLERLEGEVAERRLKYDRAEGIWEQTEAFTKWKQQEVRFGFRKWLFEEREKAVYWLAGMLVLAQIIKSMLDFYSKYRLTKVFYYAILKLKSDLYDRCLRLDLQDFQRITSGDLIARLNNDMRQVRVVFTSMVSDSVLAPFSILALIGSMVYLNWQLTIIVFFGMPLIVVPIAVIGKKLRMMGKKDEEEDSKLLDFTQEAIQGLMIVKAFAGEQREATRFQKASLEMARRQVWREKFRLYAEPFVEITASIAMALVVCMGAYVILKSDHASMSNAEFITFLFILTRFYPQFKKISTIYVKLQKSLASADRIFDIIDLPEAVAEKPDAVPLATFSDRIEFDRVAFRYSTDKPTALSNFSLTIPKGRKIALVGRTGAGKSTVARLLPRFYDASEGRILLDGTDVRDVTLKSLRQQIAVVSQETILFNSTIRENISYGKPGATLDEVRAVAKAANADEFIDKLPKGYDTRIGERGGQLSGGQRQRLAIARALLADTPILILDEATSALDNESEALVQAAIEKLMENRTVIIIAHRLSTVRKADEIIVMEDGHDVERGSYEALQAARGKFYELLQGSELHKAG